MSPPVLGPPNLKRAALRGVLLGLLLAMACWGLRGVMVGLVAIPLALVELWAERQRADLWRDLGVGMTWVLALVGLTAAWLQDPYLRAVLEDRSMAAGLEAALAELANVLHPRRHGSGAPVALFLLVLALSFSLASAVRLGARLTSAAYVCALSGAVGTWLFAWSELTSPVEAAGLMTILLVFVVGYAVPAAVILLLLYWFVDRLTLSPDQRLARALYSSAQEAPG